VHHVPRLHGVVPAVGGDGYGPGQSQVAEEKEEARGQVARQPYQALRAGCGSRLALARTARNQAAVRRLTVSRRGFRRRSQAGAADDRISLGHRVLVVHSRHVFFPRSAFAGQLLHWPASHLSSVPVTASSWTLTRSRHLLVRFTAAGTLRPRPGSGAAHRRDIAARQATLYLHQIPDATVLAATAL